MVKELYYDGKSSKDYGVFITSSDIFDGANASYETVLIPGRSGLLTISNGRFENVEFTVKLWCRDKIADVAQSLKQWLVPDGKYHRIETSYQPDAFRMGMIKGGLNFEPKQLRSGSVEVTFSCKPQLWLKSGEQKTVLSKNGSINNPTVQTAKPLIRIYGKGTVQIGNQTIEILKAPTEYIDIDCDIQDCFEGTANRNSYVSLTDFPTLVPGSNGITLGTGITKVEITPRWWTL